MLKLDWTRSKILIFLFQIVNCKNNILFSIISQSTKWMWHLHLLVATRTTKVKIILAMHTNKIIHGLGDGLTGKYITITGYPTNWRNTSISNSWTLILIYVFCFFSSNSNEFNQNQCNQTKNQHFVMSRRRQSKEAEEALAGGPNKANIFMSF